MINAENEINSDDNNGYQIFDEILKLLPQSRCASVHGYWSDGEKIICRSLEKADEIADFFEAVYSDYDEGFHTCEWDCEEDKREGVFDDYTGCAAVYYGEL